MNLDELKEVVKRAELNPRTITKTMLELSFGIELFAIRNFSDSIADTETSTTKSCFLSITRETFDKCAVSCVNGCPISSAVS